MQGFSRCVLRAIMTATNTAHTMDAMEYNRKSYGKNCSRIVYSKKNVYSSFKLQLALTFIMIPLTHVYITVILRLQPYLSEIRFFLHIFFMLIEMTGVIIYFSCRQRNIFGHFTYNSNSPSCVVPFA